MIVLASFHSLWPHFSPVARQHSTLVAKSACVADGRHHVPTISHDDDGMNDVSVGVYSGVGCIPNFLKIIKQRPQSFRIPVAGSDKPNATSQIS